MRKSDAYKLAQNELNYATRILGIELASVFLPTATKVARALSDVTGGVSRLIRESPAAQSAIEGMTAAFAAFTASILVSKIAALEALSGYGKFFAVLRGAILAVGVWFTGKALGESIGNLKLMGATKITPATLSAP